MIIEQASSVITDSLSKSTITENSKIFTEIDPIGIGMTFIGMSVVFLSLLLLYVVVYNLARILNLKFKQKTKTEGTEPKQKEEYLTGEVNAAIATALHLYFSELHDEENTVLTINRVARTYSPWSSKIYGLRQHPR